MRISLELRGLNRFYTWRIEQSILLLLFKSCHEQNNAFPIAHYPAPSPCLLRLQRVYGCRGVHDDFATYLRSNPDRHQFFSF